ncbi:hypothetical protein MKW94_015377, partial [Papaver nudicaule]|nr:hypothetical protein [Papaver nudicaule]
WLRRCVKEIVFSYTYPRLDMGVTKLTDHLLKAPFCVHPYTGRICIPIDPNRCEEFDPMAVPTLSTLYEEINSPYLKKGTQGFRDFLKPLEKELEKSHKAKIQQSKISLAW